MTNKYSRNLLFIYCLLFMVGSVVFNAQTGHADDIPEESVPTSTIDSINGPADVGSTTTIVVEDPCLDVGGVGQTAIGFLDCELPVVDVGTPPTTTTYAETLPSTGKATGGYVVIASMLVSTGILLLRLRGHSRHV